jgi:hypothetical protein
MSLSQCSAAARIKERRPFKAGNVFGAMTNGMYVAYSYGSHFPLAVHDPEAGWFVNDNRRRSLSTSRQQRVLGVFQLDGAKLMSTDNLCALVSAGSVVHRVTRVLTKAPQWVAA